MKKQTNYNPDVLSCLANLSNDEVFTPPGLVNQILDMLPNSLWQDKNAKFLDPVSKSGVFLREIAQRLLVGLEKEIPDLQERINHVYQNQIYGIGITELTSLLSRRSVYCSKTANGKYSVCEQVKSEQGNIIFDRIEHAWNNGKCEYCGANQSEYDRGESLETHAYQFIHTDEPNKIFNNMKFDVIIGNPPYQLDTGGPSRQAKPIYQLFIAQAKKLNPRYLTMIIPARWYSGGMGLENFRQNMLSDKKISKLIDFENASEVFPGVDIAGGVCYFLWERDYSGECCVISNRDGKSTALKRSLDEFEVLIRDSNAVEILRKVLATSDYEMGSLSDVVSSIGPFGLPTNYVHKNKGTPCWFIQRIGLKYAKKEDVIDKNNYLNKWKLLIPKAPIAGQTDFSKPIKFYHNKNAIIAKPGECCTDSWIIAGAFSTRDEVVSFKSYLFTKIVRFLILQTVISQDVNKRNFMYVPNILKYDVMFTDDILRERWGITNEQWDYVNSRIQETDKVYE